jgi:1-acyl-sn-glycerol-3-phosphate acyltransferase
MADNSLVTAVLVSVILSWLGISTLIGINLNKELKSFRACSSLCKERIPDVCRPFLKYENENPDDLLHQDNLFWVYLRAFWLAPGRASIGFSLIGSLSMISQVVDPHNLHLTGIKISKLFCSYVLNLRIIEYGAPDSSASTIVSNHVAIWDGLVLSASGIRGIYVANDFIAKIPLIGGIAKKMGYIFVDHELGQSRREAGEAIKNFQSSYQQEHGSGQLIVFPESTTTNQKYLCKFRKGAFRSLLPVQPVRIEYQDKNHALVVPEGLMSSIAVSLVLNGGYVKLTWLPVLAPSQGESCEEFSERVRDSIAGVSLEKIDNDPLQDHLLTLCLIKAAI